MNNLRPAAFRVYVEHTLSAALVFERELLRRSEHLQSTATAGSVQKWIKSCRDAQVQCGVLELVVMDRMEECVRCNLLTENTFAQQELWNLEVHATLFDKSAMCYVNALQRYDYANTTASRLWIVAGAAYDSVAFAEVELIEEYRQNDSNWQTEYDAFQTRYTTEASQSAEIRPLFEKALQKYSMANTYHELKMLGLNYQAMFSLAQRQAMKQCGNHGQRAANAALYITKAIDHTQQAQRYPSKDRRVLEKLWRCGARLLLQAAERSATQDLRGRQLRTVADSIAEAAQKLAEEPSAAIEHNTALLDRLQEAHRLVEEICGPGGAMEAVLEEHTNALISCLHALHGQLQSFMRKPTAEELTLRRCAARVAEVDVSLSPAHPHIRECWLKAAEQLQALAADARASQPYKRRSALLERLALGPFATAAGYFAKADRAATAQAAVLWREAGQAVLRYAVPLIGKCQAARQADLSLAHVVTGHLQYARSRHLAGAAACSERLHRAHSTLAGSAEPGLQTALRTLYAAELQLRLVVLDHWPLREKITPIDSDDEDEVADRSCSFAGLCRAVLTKCTHPHLLAPAPELSLLLGSAAAGTTAEVVQDGSARNEERIARVERLAWLCSTVAAFVSVQVTWPNNGNTAIGMVEDKLFWRLDEMQGDAFASIEAWNTRFGSYQAKLFLKCARHLGLALAHGDRIEVMHWLAAARLMSNQNDPCNLADPSVRRAVYNHLVGKAWTLRAGRVGPEDTVEDTAPLLLLSEGFSALPVEDTVLDTIANALGTFVRYDHSYDLLFTDKTRLHYSRNIWTWAAYQGAYAARYFEASVLHRADQDRSAAYAVKGARALRSAAHFAASALYHSSQECDSCYVRAGEHLWEDPPPGMPLNHARPCTAHADEVRPTTDAIAAHYVRAAEAGRAGKRQVMELWRQAAQAMEGVLKNRTADTVSAVEEAVQRAEEAEQAEQAEAHTGVEALRSGGF